MRKRAARLVYGLMLGVALSWTGTNLAVAYESVPVPNGGTVQGKVMFKGMPPPPKVFELWRFPDKNFCGAISDQKGKRLFHEVIAGQAGGLKDEVVIMGGGQQGKTFNCTPSHSSLRASTRSKPGTLFWARRNARSQSRPTGRPRWSSRSNTINVGGMLISLKFLGSLCVFGFLALLSAGWGRAAEPAVTSPGRVEVTLADEYRSDAEAIKK